MKLSDELLQQIDDYLNSRLEPQARIAFEEQLASNPSLQFEVVNQRRLLRAMRALKTKEKLNSAYQKYAEEEASNVKVQILSWTSYAVAASLVGIMVLAAYFATDWFTPKTELAFEQFYQPEVAARGECPQDLPAFKLYEQKQYEDALNAMKGQKDDSIHCVSYFIGLNLLATAQLTSAIKNLQVAQQSSSLGVRRKAIWYLGLAYLRANEEQKAEKVFRSIIDENDSENPYRQQAANILKRFF